MRKMLLLCCSVLVCSWSSSAQAALVNWTVDSSQSWARLSITDQSISFEGINVTVRLRDQGSTNQWTDGGGRFANLQGTLATNYNESAQTFSYLQGAQNVSAVETTGAIAGQFRPNPASWDPITESYTDSSGAPAAFGARVRGTALLFINVDLGFLALRNVTLDADGSSSLSGGGGNFTADSPSNFALGTSTDIDLDGFSILGNQIPSLRAESVESPLFNLTAGSLTIDNLGGLDRRMTQNFTIALEIPVDDGIEVSGTIQGSLVAYATIPEPASSSLVGLALAFGLIHRRRQTV